MSEASVWKPGTTPLVNGESSLAFQKFVATAAQEEFTLTEFEYVVGTNSLVVFKNGLILALDDDYEEIDSSSFSLVVPATLSDIVYAIGFVEVTDSTAAAAASAAAAAASALEAEGFADAAALILTATEAVLVSAEAVLTSTEEVLAEFETFYLGAKATAPTVDNEGNPLVDGALYWDTVLKSLYVYDLGTTSWNAPEVPPGLLQAANNLSDVADPATARTNLGAQEYDPDTAKTDVVQSFTVAQRAAIVALTDGATITPDFALANLFSLSLAGNRTLANPTNLVAGQCGSIFISQDGTGSRTLAYGSNWDFVGGIPPVLSTAATAVDRLDYIVRTTGSIHAVLSKNWS